MADLRILYGYPYFRSNAYRDVEQLELAYLQRLREAGWDVEGFCLTLSPPGPRLSFPDLDARWRRGDRELLGMYERLEERLSDRDVFINSVGMNLHPRFVEQLSVFTVFQCFDDPEGSDDLSRPVASAYDLCLVGNIAEVETYRSWGVKNPVWIPLGFRSWISDPALTYEQILTGTRDLDLFMMVDRLSPWRRERLDRLFAALPEAHFYGQGWPRGYLPSDQEVSFLRRAKIGPNVHNSTGPINFRTFYLPANGVMQICDNKSHLGKVFELGKEVAGFDTIEECIDLCRYYLAHDEERRRIAAEGWRRAVSDYNEAAVFSRAVSIVQEHMPGREQAPTVTGIALRQRRHGRGARVLHSIRTWFSRHLAWPVKAVLRRGAALIGVRRE